MSGLCTPEIVIIMKKASSRYLLSGIVIVLIGVWAAVSWYVWSDVGSQWIKRYPAAQAAALPFFIMSWPAYEVCLEISGVGFGANARTAAAPWTFIVFLIQAILMWSLLIAAVFIRKYSIPLLIGQIALLLLLFITFWCFGNG